MIALLANPDSGQGEADEVADAMRGLGTEVATFGLDETDAAIAAHPVRLAVAGGDGSLGSVERPFLNVASLGLSPAAAEHASGLKGTLGSLAYTAGALRAGVEADPVECVGKGDGEVIFKGEAWQVTVACTGAFGGGSSVEADPADGRLDLVVIEAESRARLVRHAYGLRAGDIEGQPGVHSVRCATAEIDLHRPERFNVDGELVESESCRFEVEPGAVSVVVG